MKTQRWIWWAVGGGVAAVLSLIVALAVLLGGPEGGGGLREDGLVVELEQIEKEGDGVGFLHFLVHNPSTTKTVRSFENLTDPISASYLKVHDEHGNSCVLEDLQASILMGQGILMIPPKQTVKIHFPVFPPKEASRLYIQLGPLVNNTSTDRRFSVVLKKTDAHKGILFKRKL